MTDLVQETKAVLLDTHFLKKIELSLLYKEDPDDEKYPNQFWEVKYSNKFEKEEDWNLNFSCHCKSLPQAIGQSILLQSNGQFFIQCEIPDNLKKHWRLYKITIIEHITRKEKWGEERINKRASISYQIRLSDGMWAEDYSEGALNLETALCFVPKRYWNMSEGFVPHFLDYRNTDENLPSHESYPTFKYEGHYFKSTRYIPNQKCICGESDTYYNNYDQNNQVKVEVWDTQCFEKDVINFDGTHLIFNETVIKLSEEDRKKYEGFISDKEMNILRNKFPSAKAYNGDMESRNFGDKK